MVREGAQGEPQSLICGEPQPILHKDGTSTMLGQVFSFTSLTRALLFFWDVSLHAHHIQNASPSLHMCESQGGANETSRMEGICRLRQQFICCPAPTASNAPFSVPLLEPKLQSFIDCLQMSS